MPTSRKVAWQGAQVPQTFSIQFLLHYYYFTKEEPLCSGLSQPRGKMIRAAV